MKIFVLSLMCAIIGSLEYLIFFKVKDDIGQMVMFLCLLVVIMITLCMLMALGL